MEKIKIETTKTGLPALWESGGGWTNTGQATIVASPNGGPKRPLYIRKRGHLACGQHALVPIKNGDYVINVSRWRDTFKIKILKVIKILSDSEEAEVEEVPEVLPQLEAAVEAAVTKTRTYHCREAVYVRT